MDNVKSIAAAGEKAKALQAALATAPIGDTLKFS